MISETWPSPNNAPTSAEGLTMPNELHNATKYSKYNRADEAHLSGGEPVAPSLPADAAANAWPSITKMEAIPTICADNARFYCSPEFVQLAVSPCTVPVQNGAIERAFAAVRLLLEESPPLVPFQTANWWEEVFEQYLANATATRGPSD